MIKSKRTRVLLWILGGLVVIGLAVFIYGWSSGAFESSADTTAPTTTFSDVPSTYWAYNSIKVGAEFGLIAGYPDGTFKPTQNVTRDQAAVFIARAIAGDDAWVPAGPATPHCSDVPSTHWAYKYVEYLITEHMIGTDCRIMTGVGTANKYLPSQNMTRGDLAPLIARLVAGDPAIPAGPGTPTFTDVSSSNPAYRYIEYLNLVKVVTGYSDGTYRPSTVITRDQMAVYIDRAYDLQATSAYIDSITAVPGGLGLFKRAFAGVGISGNDTTVTLTGTVTDKATSKPIGGATVAVKCTNGISIAGIEKSGTNTSVKTNSNGTYSVTVESRFDGKIGLLKKKKVWIYDVTASASGYNSDSANGLSWGKATGGTTVGPQDFQLTKGNAHLECDSSKKCVQVTGPGDNKCSKDSDCLTPGPTPTPYAGLTGSVSGPVCLKGMGSSTTTDSVCNKTGYHLFKPGDPMNTMFSMTVTPVPSGWTSGNMNGMVNGAGYLVKNMVNGSPVFLTMPVGSYTANNVELKWPTPYGLKGAKGDSSYSFNITSGNKTSVTWYMLVQ